MCRRLRDDEQTAQQQHAVASETKFHSYKLSESASCARHFICGSKAKHIVRTYSQQNLIYSNRSNITNKQTQSKPKRTEIVSVNGFSIYKLNCVVNETAMILWLTEKNLITKNCDVQTSIVVERQREVATTKQNSFYMKKVLKFIHSMHKRIENSALSFREFLNNYNNNRSNYQYELSMRFKRMRIIETRRVFKRFTAWKKKYNINHCWEILIGIGDISVKVQYFFLSRCRPSLCVCVDNYYSYQLQKIEKKSSNSLIFESFLLPGTIIALKENITKNKHT